MLDLIPKKKFNFLGKRWIAAILSIVMIGASIIVFAIRGEKNFGHFRQRRRLCSWWIPNNPSRFLRTHQALRDIGLGDVVIQFEREGMQSVSHSAARKEHPVQILSKLQEAFRDRDVTPVAGKHKYHKSDWSSPREPHWLSVWA